MADVVFDCTGCKYYRSANGDKMRYCHYATDNNRCRVINKKSVPAEKCFKKKVFFEEK